MGIHREINLAGGWKAPGSSHLSAMGGTAPDGTTYAVNSRYLTKNNAPWIPVMGEFHFSRVPRVFWRQELLKMKSLGATIISSYVFWLHHEEERGIWDWEGDKDLSAFTALIKELGLLFWLRVGPWPHGEARNGGFPDWLMEEEKKGMVLRSDDPAYLTCVRELYRQIGLQIGPSADVRRGGPVIGVQIENEYGHCGGPGSDDHIRTLMALAGEMGITAPYTSVTGWGGANIPRDEVLPVMGGYPAHPWTQNTEPLGPMGEYLFKPLANDPRIGGDLAGKPQINEDLTWDPERTPYLTCELGGGIQVTGHRRPWLSHDDVAALILCKIGCGVNMPGYYMFHGGTNPIGKTGYTQESRETGSPNDVPRLSYDFQAMVGEYGRIRRSGLRNKLLHYFLRDFGHLLAPLAPVFPESSPVDPEDSHGLRWAIRTNGESGFLFINNHSRLQDLPPRDVSFLFHTGSGEISLPPMNIPPHAYGFLPLNMPLKKEGGEILINRATVQPVCFYEETSGRATGYFLNFTGNPGFIEVTLPGSGETERFEFPREGGRIDLSEGTVLHVLTRDEGEKFWYGESAGKRKALISPDPVIFTERGAYRLKETTLSPALEFISRGEGLYELPPGEIAGKLSLREEIFLKLDLICDRGEFLLDGELAADFFYYGESWEIGLRRFANRISAESLIQIRLFPPEGKQNIYFDCPRPGKEVLRKVSLTGMERVA